MKEYMMIMKNWPGFGSTVFNVTVQCCFFFSHAVIPELFLTFLWSCSPVSAHFIQEGLPKRGEVALFLKKVLTKGGKVALHREKRIPEQTIDWSLYKGKIGR